MVHKHKEILNNRNAIFSLCETSFVKRAVKLELSLDRMWRHFSLGDVYTKISGVFCPAPVLSWQWATVDISIFWHGSEAFGSKM